MAGNGPYQVDVFGRNQVASVFCRNQVDVFFRNHAVDFLFRSQVGNQAVDPFSGTRAWMFFFPEAVGGLLFQSFFTNQFPGGTNQVPARYQVDTRFKAGWVGSGNRKTRCSQNWVFSGSKKGCVVLGKAWVFHERLGVLVSRLFSGSGCGSRKALGGLGGFRKGWVVSGWMVVSESAVWLQAGWWSQERSGGFRKGRAERASCFR